MKRRFSVTAMAVLILLSLPLSGQAAEFLIPVGRIIGLHLNDNTVIIAAYGANARDAGLRIGDQILSVNGSPVCHAQEVPRLLAQGSGPVEITVRRSGKLHTLEITPTQTPEGCKLGLYLRQGIAGIGTVTWYDPATGNFGALGHGVSTPKGTLLELSSGEAYEARVQSVIRGKCGEPGQLRGDTDQQQIGQILRNTPQGVFGKAIIGWYGQPMPVAAFEDVRTGPAVIRSTVSGNSVREYSVEIIRIYPMEREDNRNFLLRITDPELLNTTGGIVQGMSGSPIIQDGKLVGAVTHVLVNDPTRGYGIFIENMLDAAG